jgi:Tfp pilus assembly protein FimT
VVAVMSVLAAAATLVMPGALQTARADSSMTAVVAALRVAREEAISQRRHMQVTFTAPNRIVVSRVEVPGPTLTVTHDERLTNSYTFRLFSGMPDTPDAFGNATAMAFGGASTIRFTSAGEFVDQNGDPVNGTVFIGRDGETLSARAVSIFGPTALIRQWRWSGNAWIR